MSNPKNKLEFFTKVEKMVTNIIKIHLFPFRIQNYLHSLTVLL